jgi:hypothetical protein
MRMKFSVVAKGPASSSPVLTSQTRLTSCDDEARVLPWGDKPTVWTGFVPAVLVIVRTVVAQALCRPGIFESMEASPRLVGSLKAICGIRLAMRYVQPNKANPTQ